MLNKYRGPDTLAESSIQVSHIEHVKRDEILDDSLLFALQDDQAVNRADMAHLDDEEEEEEEEGNILMIDA